MTAVGVVLLVVGYAVWQLLGEKERYARYLGWNFFDRAGAVLMFVGIGCTLSGVALWLWRVMP